MNIVYSSSDAYAECTGVSLWSLYSNNEHIEDLNVYILDTDISAVNRERLLQVAEHFNRRIVFIDAAEGFIQGAEQLNLPMMRGSYNTYSRVLMNTWFGNLDKVFVIDSDTLICGDIEDIWDVDMEGMLVGAVPEVAMYGKYNNLEDSAIIENVPMYYNMGMCLINLKEWRKKRIDEFIKAQMNNEQGGLKIADQSIINKYLNPYIVRLGLKYNFYSVVHGIDYSTIVNVFEKKEVFTKDEFESAKKEKVIIHYFGHSFERPWFKYNAAYRKHEYLDVRNKTPWRSQVLQKWKKADHWVLRIYDAFSYLMLLCGFRSFCLKFRYVYGQKIKGITGIHR